MCILFVYVNPEPEPDGYRVILASNRDEYYKRPAKDAFKCPNTGLVGGRDMEPGREGGMWLGLKTHGKLLKFAALLNITGEKYPNANGRGVLVTDYLDGPERAPNYMNRLQSENKLYNGFNLMCLELQENEANIYLHSNTPRITSNFYGKHVLGFGNSPVNSPFTKVTNGRKLFKEIISKNATKEDLVKDLLALMKLQDNHLPDQELEARAPIAYHDLSSIFVEINGLYGTRAHSILLVDYDYQIDFAEYAMEQPIDLGNIKWSKSVIKSNL